MGIKYVYRVAGKVWKHFYVLLSKKINQLLMLVELRHRRKMLNKTVRATGFVSNSRRRMRLNRIMLRNADETMMRSKTSV